MTGDARDVIEAQPKSTSLSSPKITAASSGTLRKPRMSASQYREGEVMDMILCLPGLGGKAGVFSLHPALGRDEEYEKGGKRRLRE
jgi:hypothetical protein